VHNTSTSPTASPHDYTGPLTKTDAQRVLDLLIAQDSETYVPPNTLATVAMIAREYLPYPSPIGDRARFLWLAVS